jgi:hypothetical protein
VRSDIAPAKGASDGCTVELSRRQEQTLMEGAKFQLGDEVQIGEIRAVFKTKNGEIRYVVEKEDGRLVIREEHELFHFDVIEETPDEEE